MRTETSIANMACDFLDVDPIGSLQRDQSGIGKSLRRNYDEARETVLSEFSWNSAQSRATLTEWSDPPGFASHGTDDQHVYLLPPTCKRVNEINGRPVEDITYRVEQIALTDGNGLITSRRKVLVCSWPDSVVIRFNDDIPAADMDPHLAKAVALELAQRCIMKAANSTQKWQWLVEEYARATIGDSKRKGGFQVDSRQNNVKLTRKFPSTGARARAGSI